MLKIALLDIDCPTVLTLQKSYAILLVTKGQGTLTLDPEKIELMPERIFLLRKNMQTQLEGFELTVRLIEFQDVVLRKFLTLFITHRDKGLFNLKTTLPYVDLNIQSLNFLRCMIEVLDNEVKSGASAFAFTHYFFVLLRHVNREVEWVTTSEIQSETRVRTLKILIDENYKEHRKITFYAAKMGMNARQLNNFTREFFNLNFFAFLMERTFAEADLLLTESKLSIKAIAYDLSFSNQSQFGLYYRRHRGCTPSTFRKKYYK